MTKALHRKRQAAKAVEDRSSNHGHRLLVAREVLEATHDPSRVVLLCQALEWEAEAVLHDLTTYEAL